MTDYLELLHQANHFWLGSGLLLVQWVCPTKYMEGMGSINVMLPAVQRLLNMLWVSSCAVHFDV
jgi:hypothetical protein